MSIHKVSVDIPAQELGKSDVIFSVRKDSAKLGQLHVSHGAVVWFPSNKQFGQKLSWVKLAELFEKHGTEKAEKKKA